MHRRIIHLLFCCSAVLLFCLALPATADSARKALPPDPRADINGDGRIDGADLSVLMAGFDKVVQPIAAPEPPPEPPPVPIPAAPSVRRFNHERILFLAVSNPEMRYQADYELPVSRRAEPSAATLSSVWVNRLRRTTATAVMIWGLGGPVDAMPHQWSPVWPGDLHHTPRGTEARELVSLINDLRLVPINYVGVANTPVQWQGGQWIVHQRAAGGDWISPLWGDQAFVTQLIARSTGDGTAGIALDASYYPAKHYPEQWLRYCREVGAIKTVFTEGPISSEIPDHLRAQIHAACVEIGVVNVGYTSDAAGRRVYKRIRDSPDVLTFTDPARRAWIAARVTGARQALFANGSEPSPEQVAELTDLCTRYGITLIAAWH